MRKENIICDNCGKNLFNNHNSNTIILDKGKKEERKANLPFVTIHSATINLSTMIGYNPLEIKEKDFCGRVCMFAYIRKRMYSMMLSEKQRFVNEEEL